MAHIVEYIIETFNTENFKEVLVFFISLLPVIEAKGGLLAASLMNIPLMYGIIIAFLGNVFPVSFLLIFLKKIMIWMSKYKIFEKILKKLNTKVEKNKESIEKYGYYGLFLFIAIPLPGTGAYTGTLIASCLNMNMKKSAIIIFIGTLCSVLVLACLYYGLLGMIF